MMARFGARLSRSLQHGGAAHGTNVATRYTAHLGARVGRQLDGGARELTHELGNVADARGLRDLVENLHPLSRLGRVVDRELDALARVRNVNERPRLAAGALRDRISIT